MSASGNAPLLISGEITIADSTTGVANLVVVAEHVRGGERTTRLASTTTGSDGGFHITVPPPKWNLWALFRSPTWDLRVVVLAPEADDTEDNSRVLFVAETRFGARVSEEFVIVLTRDRLEAAHVPLPASPIAQTRSVASALEASREQTQVLQHATDAIFRTRFDSVERRRKLFRNQVVGRLRGELSAVTEAERASDRFVPDDGEIEAIHRAAIGTDVNALGERQQDPQTGDDVATVRLTSRLLVKKDVADVLLPGNNPLTLTEAELEQALGFDLDKPPVVYRRHLEPDPCRPRDDAECCLDDAPPGENGDGEDGNGEGGGENGDDGEQPPVELESDSSGDSDSDGADLAGSNVTFRKGRLIADLFRRQTSPEDPVEFGSNGDLEGPLTAGGVADVIAGVTLAPGPADVPAFHDFHDLQIAFEPVWQEALDDRYLKDVEAAYDQIVERGGAPAVNRVGGLLGGQVRFLDGLLDVLDDIGAAADSEVPPSVAAAVYISLEEWRALGSTARAQLSALASRVETLREEVIAALDPDNIPDVDVFNIGEMIRAANTKASIALRAQIQLLTSDAERIVAHARRLLLDREAKEPFRPSHEVIDRLRAARGTAYPFRFFAASSAYRSVNFGIMVTYRQLWTPVSYQVGELVNTIPLAPREIRRFSKKTVVRTKRAIQEVESNLVSRRTESEEHSRAESEIVARAIAKTNFTLTQSGTVNIGENAIGGSTTTTTSFTRDAEKHSESVKKEFREAILKSAEEYRSERKVEVSTEESFESEVTESGEIQNPNDEIPVTFLFYELQRRFKVAEKLHRLQSVVLVAQEVPVPSAIDAAWLVQHDWILNRVLLDDSFRPALTFASTTMISDDVVLREMRHALFRQRKLVEELKEDVEDRRALTGLRYAALQRQIERTAASAGGGGGGLFGGLGKLVGGVPLVGDLVQGGLDLLSGGDTPSEAAQIREGAARDAFEREQREEQELASRLQNAISALEAMQREFTSRLGSFLTQLAQVERLSSHVVQNISYYMQAIWAHEPDDQRYLRLRNVPVPVFEKDKSVRSYLIDAGAVLVDRPVLALRSLDVRTDFGILNPPAQPQQIETKPLSEVADIGRPLGFLGNYLIFPLVESNPITEFMMDPYVTVAEGEYGISDPDPLGNMTLDEFCEYVCCLKRYFDERDEEGDDETDGGDDETDGGDDVENGNGGDGETDGGDDVENGNGGDGETDGGDDVENGDDGDTIGSFEDLKPELRAALRDLLQRSLRNNEEVVVPSNSLYIEALPGAHSVMEKFKNLHRQIDVKIAQSRLREAEVDNIRQAQRILDNELEDPDIEAKYVFEGAGSAAVVAPAPPGPGGGGSTPGSG
jgi:hypothetical protein